MSFRTSPQPSTRAENLLLALFALDPDAPHGANELDGMTDLLGMEPSELTERLNELRTMELVAPGPEPDTIVLTPHAYALVLELVEDRLTDEILRQRPLQEQAEALIIWHSAQDGVTAAQA